MWVRMGSQVLFLSLFTRFFSYTHLAIRLILFPLGALAWSFFCTFLMGILFVRYKETYRNFIESMKKTDVYEEK